MSDSRTPATGSGTVRVTLIGGPTALIQYGGLRLLTDPAFDEAGPHPVGQRVLTKLTGPAIAPDDLGAVDAVLLSHDQHPDNLDDAGRAYLGRAPVVITTTTAAGRLDAQTVGLEPWKHTELALPGGGGTVTVHAVPAHHGPEDGYEASGPVIGFVLTGDGLPTVYVSGDNASLGVVEEVADNLGPIHGAVLFAGRARTALLDAYLTLSAAKAARAAQLLHADWVVPVHAEGWAHFTESVDDVADAFERAGISSLLHVVPRGETVELPGRD